MKSIYEEQLESLSNKNLAVGDIVSVEMYYYGSENTFFKARIEVAVDNPKEYKLGQSCHFTDKPIRLRILENCSKDWMIKGDLTPIHRIINMQKITEKEVA